MPILNLFGTVHIWEYYFSKADFDLENAYNYIVNATFTRYFPKLYLKSDLLQIVRLNLGVIF